jgi:FkbM family methyltransferase
MNLWLRFGQRIGLLRSVFIYYGIPLRRRRLSRFYAQFIRPGDLCFDIGSHVGSRLWAWSKLGARIVAVEPQPQCMRLLRHWYGNQSHITLIQQAVGPKPGTGTLFVSPRSPTVTTLSAAWIETVKRDNTFNSVRWEYTLPVTVTTLDTLIARFGLPSFCKIDVEGYELEVLQGLSQPLRALSFEYISVCLEAVRASIAYLAKLGTYEFNWSVGESQHLRSKVWLSAEQLGEQLDTIVRNSRSGDIYARLR